MPNIEIHGLSDQQAMVLVGKIFVLLKENSDAAKIDLDEIVITYCPTRVVDIKGIIRPFLRLITTACCLCNEGKIIEILTALGMDIEHIEAIDFYPKKQETVV